MKSIGKSLPNMMSLLRIVLACIVNIYLYNNYANIKFPIILTVLIYATDFFDGRIARFYKCTSRLGAILDVMADLFYMVVSYLVLYKFHILPLWFLFIILFKFIEFVVTSSIFKKISSVQSIFVFDLIGRYAASFFYVIPIIAYIFFLLNKDIYWFIINILIFFITFMVIISSTYRIRNILRSVKNENCSNIQI